MNFETLRLDKDLNKELENQKYKSPYPIQIKAIPFILNGNDVLGIAPTGSGKTASFVLPVLTLLQEQKVEKSRKIRCLVLVPTRELALQVQEVFYQFGNAMNPPIISKAVYGGVSIQPQMKSLFGTQVLVATPGRLLELIEKKAIQMSRLETLILDEADKLLNMGFKEEMGKIFAHLPKKRQTLLFSATLSKEVENLNQIVLKNPEVIQIKAKETDVSLIQQTGYHVEENRKGPLLRHLILEHNMNQVLVFTSSVYQADHVADKLRKNDIDAVAIHSKKSQGARKDALARFKKGTLRVLVATDLLSRGIDIEFLPYVVNYELPRSPKDYIHRIGRTGRAENPGEAIVFVTEKDQHHFKVIQKKMKRWVDMVDTMNLNF